MFPILATVCLYPEERLECFQPFLKYFSRLLVSPCPSGIPVILFHNLLISQSFSKYTMKVLDVLVVHFQDESLYIIFMCLKVENPVYRPDSL